MNIGVISDTHGNGFSLKRAYNAIINATDGDVAAFFHCGDYAADALTLATLTNLPIYAVCGNCDTSTVNNPFIDVDNPYSRVVELGGLKFFLTHGHLYDVNNSILTLALYAKEMQCDAAVFGHTHMSTIDNYGELMILNPGSPTRPLGGTVASAALISVNNNKCHLTILSL